MAISESKHWTLNSTVVPLLVLWFFCLSSFFLCNRFARYGEILGLAVAAIVCWIITVVLQQPRLFCASIPGSVFLGVGTARSGTPYPSSIELRWQITGHEAVSYFWFSMFVFAICFGFGLLLMFFHWLAARDSKARRQLQSRILDSEAVGRNVEASRSAE